MWRALLVVLRRLRAILIWPWDVLRQDTAHHHATTLPTSWTQDQILQQLRREATS